MEQYLERYNQLTTNGQLTPGPPQETPQQVPQRYESPTNAGPGMNYLPQAPTGSPQLPLSIVNPGAVQQQQQSIGEQFMPALQMLNQLAQQFPEGSDQLQQAASLVLAVMQQQAAQFSQGGIPRSIV